LLGNRHSYRDHPTQLSFYMFALTTAYGTRISENVGVGFGVKYYRDKLAPDEVLQDGTGGTGSTYAFDAGLLWKIPAMKMNVAVAVANLGKAIKHVDDAQSDPLPRKITFGVARSLFYTDATSLLFVADYLVPLMDWNEDQDDYGFAPDFDESEWGAGLEWAMTSHYSYESVTKKALVKSLI